MLRLQEVSTRDLGQWDRLVLQSPRGLLFHMSDWLEAVRAAQRLPLIRLGIYDGDRIVGVFPVFLKRFAVLTVVASPLVIEDTHYMGPVVDDDALPEVMRLFREYVAKRWVMSYSRLVLMHDPPREAFAALGYECVDNRTHVVDLSLAESALWQRVKPACRRQIKKAERAGITTEIVTDDRYLDRYYDVMLALYTRQKRTPPSPKSFFRSVWDRFGPEGHLVWVIATQDGQVAAGCLLGVWKGTIFFIDGVSSQAHQNLGASNALHWAGIQWAKKNNHRFYDFVGSNIPRFAQFKGSFGGDLLTYLTLERANPTWVRMLRERYAAYKGLMYQLSLKAQKLRGGRAAVAMNEPTPSIPED
jgi:hypothetical protein